MRDVNALIETGLPIVVHPSSHGAI